MKTENKPYRFDTQVIHAGQSPASWDGATLSPIFQTASHLHPTAESLSQTFAGQTTDHIYMRLTNPTNRTLEEKLTVLEGGQGAVVMSSGMAAVANACLALLRSGDEFVAGNSLFMSTYLLFTKVFSKYNLKARLIEPTSTKAMAGAINEKTRFVFVETIGNPKLDIPRLKEIAQVAHHEGIPLIVDNTLATPYLCRPFELGADIVIHSTTKYLSGHGAAVGGVVIDRGAFPWPADRFPDFKPFIDRKGPLAFLDKVWREHHINFGTTQSPFHSFLTMLGLDTLSLRMERTLKNAALIAEYLKGRPEVVWVNYPGFKDHPSHLIAGTQFEGKGFGGLITFGLKNQAACFDFINRLRLIYHLANLGDCKTLVIHPYSSQYISFDDETRKSLGIFPDLIRLSVGIEDAGDLCEDLSQSLEGLSLE
jgi:O-acetylhomoserine (thiol)-lyase